MPAAIQLTPAGLLGLLQLKNEGRNPQNLIETIQPVIDCFELYRGSARESRSTDDILFAVGANPVTVFTNGDLAVVPSNEFWFVDFLTVRILTLGVAGDIGGLAPCFFSRTADGANNQPHVVGPTSVQGSDAVGGGSVISANDRPFLMCPGDQPGCWGVRESAAAGFVFRLSMRFARMRT